MFRYKSIRNLLILSLAIAFLLPAYDFIYVHPSYDDLITEKTEDEAVRYASYMVRTLGLEDQTLSRETLPDDLEYRLKPVSRDRQLFKLRIFSANGEIVFSTKKDEIGTINRNDYFHNFVAKGQVYSKIVRKDRKTAEGVVSHIDIVETYVPFMVEDKFAGAFEVYYDVTPSVNKTKNLAFLSRTTSVVMSIAFLLAIFVALYRADESLLERDAAEVALRDANESLEKKVSDRTRELVDANELLTEQIAERIRAENALNRALDNIRLDREKLDEILRSVPDGVVVADAGLNILHMNLAAEEMLQLSLDEMIGKSISNLSTTIDFRKKVSQRLNITHGSRSFDIELPCSDGQKTCVYQVRISQFVPEEDGKNGIVLLIRDVTRERDIERMKSAFLGMAAHELNTPLTTIIGYTELLTTEETAKNFDQQQKTEYLHLIHDKAIALGGLIDDLLDISRVESGRALTVCYEEFDLKEKILSVIKPYKDADGEYEFDLLLPEDCAPVCADKTRLEQVVDHLISNAVKYSPGGGSISVELTGEDEEYTLTVTDEGIGMNEEQLAHIYDRFYRADSRDTAVQGVGLGMSIVRHIVLAHHGDINVESQPGNGTRVFISLPKTPPVGDTESSQPFRS
jgi:PAS domain S-box-containing protein